MNATPSALRFLAAHCLGLAIGLVLGTPAQARYVRPDLEKVPVERLTESLEAAVKKDPKDVQAVLNLARVHAMAYSLKTDIAEVRKGKEVEGPWFGYEPKFVPFSDVQKTEDAAKRKAAEEHLAKAVELYQQAVKLAVDNLPARLGYAWILDQSGKKEDAIKEYRKLIDEAWAKEKDLKSLPLGGHTITAEAAGYLVPLLDKDKDKEEIATLNERIKLQQSLPRPVTPIVIPLRDGLCARDLEDGTASVAFDADGSGRKNNWTWVTRDAGWLVYAPSGKREVTSALQLFGNVSFWLFWENGYQALAALDDNHDGVLTGKELEGLAIWHDVNGNGVCDPGEVQPLSAHGVVALWYRHEIDRSHPDRIAFAPAGVLFWNGTIRPTYDLVLHRK